MLYSPGFCSALIIIYRVPARIAVGLGTVYSSNMDTFTHKMQAFREHLQYAITIYKVKVNTNRMIFMVKSDFQEIGHNQPSWTDSTLMLIYIFGTNSPLM